MKALGDKDGATRRTALDALRQRKDPASAPALVRCVADPVWHGRGPFVARGDNPDWYDPAVRNDALDLLRGLAPGEVTGALLTALRSPQGEVRDWTLRQLAKVKDPASVPALARCVADRAWLGRGHFAVAGDSPDYHDPALRERALVLLQELAKEEATKALEEAAESKTPEVKAWALRKLAAAKS
jgi:HEAT repeat protein